MEQTDRWVTRAGARLDGITADILRLLEERDRWFLEDCARLVELTGEGSAANSVGYPTMADLEEVAARGIAAGWGDAEAEVLGALEELGEGVLRPWETATGGSRQWLGGISPHPSVKPCTAGLDGRPLPVGEVERRIPQSGSGRRAYGELTRGQVAEAVDLVIEGERLVVPRDGIDRYVEHRIPPLRWTIEESRKLLVRDLVVKAASDGLDVRRTMELLLREGIERSVWNRETIARTEAGTLYNHGRLARYRASACVTGYRFSSVLDDRTTPVCEHMHGRVFRKDEIDGVEPPLHFCCRSLLVPIILDDNQDWERAEDVLNGLDERLRPRAGFGDVDLTSMPAPRSVGDLYRPLLESEKAELRDLYVVIMSKLGAAA